MGVFNLKPHLKTIDVSKLEPKHIEYFCRTQVIDKTIILRIGEEWNQELADVMEKPYAHYFVVKKNMDYDVISGLLFDEFLKANELEVLPETDKAKKCIEHYIKKLR